MRPDPEWLDDGYRTTRDLLDVDERSYRFVISAVMACHRSLWDDIEGFDPTRDEYGGDDWEFASRAYNNGAVLVHDRSAVAWHDEPDWADRDGGSKNDETLWLAEVIAEPATRGPGVRQRDPALLVTIAATGPPGALVATLGDVLAAAPDCRIHLAGEVAPAVRRYCSSDDRVSASPPSPIQRRRARWHLHLPAPARWRASGLTAALRRLGPAGCGRVDVVADDGRVVAAIVSTRATARVRRAGGDDGLLAELFGAVRIGADEAGVTPIAGEIELAAVFGGW